MNEDLLQLKKKIERKKQELASAKGRSDQILSTLKKDFQIDSYPEAEIQVKKMEKEIARKREKLEAEIKKFQEDYSALLEQ